MPVLPDEWHELERPARLPDIDLFISGDGSCWEMPIQLQHGNPLEPTPLTGMDIDAEFRTDGDELLVALETAWTDQANGASKISTTNSAVIALCLPCDAPPRGKRFKLGRMQFAVTDDIGRWVVATADVWGNR